MQLVGLVGRALAPVGLTEKEILQPVGLASNEILQPGGFAEEENMAAGWTRKRKKSCNCLDSNDKVILPLVGLAGNLAVGWTRAAEPPNVRAAKLPSHPDDERPPPKCKM